MHQPKRIGKFSVFDIAKKDAQYFDEEKNRYILNRIVRESYEPSLKLFSKLSNDFKNNFKLSFSISGVLIEELLLHFPEIIQKIRDLINSKSLELIAETYYHSLSFIYSIEEFTFQVKKQKKLFREIFNFNPTIFRNTEFIYNNDLANLISKMGFKAVFVEGADKILKHRSPNYLYSSKNPRVLVFTKNYKLSDDIAFRFSEKSWRHYPLDADKYLSWIENSPGDIINLMMDFETFGEHHKIDSGIFKFLESFVTKAVKKGFNFILPSKAIKNLKPADIYDSIDIVTWADTERDLSAWLGNDLQKHATNELYSLKNKILKSNNHNLIDSFRLLQTSDHFYYMCTKWFADGDVHKYFNPYESPYEAYLSYMNVLEDLKIRLYSDSC